MIKILTTLTILTLTGCGLGTVRDYDSGKLEREQVARIKQAQASNKATPTPDYVKVADSDDVIVEVNKTKPTHGAQGIVLDVWKVTATNHSATPKCVKIEWKLMDFNFETSLPYEFLIKDHQLLKVGTMTQNVWSFSETAIAMPPSGYVEAFNVRDADYDEKLHKYTCDMTEAQIDEPK